MSDDRVEGIVARVEARNTRLLKLFVAWTDSAGPLAELRDVMREVIADETLLLSALREARADTKRLDWLEGEMVRERAILDAPNFDLRAPLPKPLFRRNVPITRAALDAAIHGEVGDG